MLDLNELEQLITFADMGTLSLAAEKLHISQPTITRTTQHLEETFGVSLLAKDPQNLLAGRIKIPVTNPEANVTYYLVCHSQSIAYTDVLKRK